MSKHHFISLALLLILPMTSSIAAPITTAWFAPYVDASAWPKPDLQRLAQPPNEKDRGKSGSGVKHYTLAFLVDKNGSACQATWGTYYPLDYMLNDVKGLRDNRNGDVMISLGGQANTPLAAACPSPEALANVYETIVNTYQLAKLDFDIEGLWASDAKSLQRRVDALKIFQKNYPQVDIWLTLPVLPSGLTDGEKIVDQMVAAGINLAGVNIMAMDYGDGSAPYPAGKMGKYAINAATALHKQLTAIYQKYAITKSDAQIWQMIGITPMIGRNDVPSEIFTLTDAQQVTDFAKQKHIPLIGMWSMNRDRQCEKPSLPYASTNCSSIPQQTFAFSKIFDHITQ